MLRPKAESNAPPCAICKAPAFGVAWGTNLCDEHHAQWYRESPTCGLIEAHAPEADVEGRHRLSSGDWAITLKAGVLDREYSKWTQAWVVKCRADRARTALAAPRSDERAVRP